MRRRREGEREVNVAGHGVLLGDGVGVRRAFFISL